MFGINGNQVKWAMAMVQWIVKSLQAIAIKLGVTLDPPPAPPS